MKAKDLRDILEFISPDARVMLACGEPPRTEEEEDTVAYGNALVVVSCADPSGKDVTVMITSHAVDSKGNPRTDCPPSFQRIVVDPTLGKHEATEDALEQVKQPMTPIHEYVEAERARLACRAIEGVVGGNGNA